ncbi:perlucin-like protein [Pomacea canaliculata]|uniref:perlucin-like protein n=1 Tax=Pomacea canaliculata TaxID=400727 RepID=UPI000D733384|nr:perlucin-like protein [Pomacea canaliculata]
MRSEFRITSTLATFIMFMLMFAQDADGRCDSDWEHFNGSCYKYIAHTVTYPSALGTCNKEGYYLLEINSEEENTFIGDFIIRHKVRSVWQGVNDIFAEGHWVYSRTGGNVSFTHWYTGEPNNRGNEDCAEFDTNRLWNDMACNLLLPFICENNPYAKITENVKKE